MILLVVGCCRVVRDDIEEEDDQVSRLVWSLLPHSGEMDFLVLNYKESYFRAVASAPIVIGEGEEDVEYEYDSDGNPIVPDRAKVCICACVCVCVWLSLLLFLMISYQTFFCACVRVCVKGD